MLATDVDGVYRHWHTPQAQVIHATTPQELETYAFPAGSMALVPFHVDYALLTRF